MVARWFVVVGSDVRKIDSIDGGSLVVDLLRSLMT